MDILLYSKSRLKTRGRPVFRLIPLALAHYFWKEGDLNSCETGDNFQLWTGGGEGKNSLPWSQVFLNFEFCLNFSEICHITLTNTRLHFCLFKEIVTRNPLRWSKGLISQIPEEVYFFLLFSFSFSRGSCETIQNRSSGGMKVAVAGLTL